MRFISRAVFFFIMLFAGTHFSYAKKDAEKKDAEKNNTTKGQASNDTSPPSNSGDLIQKALPNTPVETNVIDGNDQLKEIFYQKAKKQ